MTGYLTLSRRHGQGITLTDGTGGGTIQIMIAMDHGTNRVRVSIAAPPTWAIVRSELLGTDAPEPDMGGEA